jgi:hypothetical protein
MKNKIKIFAMILISLAIIQATVFAFGEVAGPVVIHVPLGGTNVSSWGIFNGEAIDAKISTEGDAAKFISFPEKVSLERNNKIYWVNITAKIPADYNLTQGTNITGTLYALTEGKPGQVQINLQVKKTIQIIVEQPQISEENMFSNYLTGLFALQAYSVPVVGIIAVIVLIVLLGIFYIAKIKKEVKN